MTASSDQRDDPDEPKLDGNSQTRESAGSDAEDTSTSNAIGGSDAGSETDDEEFESWVVDVCDIGEDGDAAYLVMELLHGDSLRRRLTSGALEPSEAVDLLIPAMRGVAAANRQEVIHRDLKPDNIFLCAGRWRTARGQGARLRHFDHQRAEQ
jgi:serine/threonine protein kinase